MITEERFPYDKKNHKAAALKEAEFVKAVAFGSETLMMLICLFCWVVCHFQACIYQKNSLPSTLSPDCPDIGDKLQTDPANYQINYNPLGAELTLCPVAIYCICT